MSVITIKDLKGGLNLQEPTTLKDNQFETLTNMGYDADGRLISRRGITTFGNAISGGQPITSAFFLDDQKNGIRTLIAASGTDMWEYDEGTGNWSSIKSGLTQFESDGVTHTRWSFAVLREKIYLCNGVDDYAEYDPNTSTWTDLPTQPKVRHLAYLADAIRGAGEDSNPALLYVTNALGATAADGRTLNANDVLVGGAESGRINGLQEQQQSVLAFKDKEIYSIAGDLTAAQPLDSENGGYGDRAIKRSGNSLIYFNDRGFNTLKSKQGITGVTAIQDTPLSDDIRALTSLVSPKQYNYTIGQYILPLTNYYGSFDTSGDDKPDTTVVFSTLTRGWSRYTYPSHYDFVNYKDSDGVIHYLIASATGGQLFEIETGFDDLGADINCELVTKAFDLGDDTSNSLHTAVQLSGLKSEGDDIDIDILVDGQSVAGGVITDDYIDITSSVLTIGTRPIGSYPIGGGAIGDNGVDLYKYIIRIPLYEIGRDIQVKMTSTSQSLVWSLDKIRLDVDNESFDFFEYENIG